MSIGEELKRGALAIVLIFLAVAAIYYVAISPQNEQKIEPLTPQEQNQNYEQINIINQLPQAVCKNGDAQHCIYNGCVGEKQCISGQWTTCIVNKICRPGRVAPCPLDSCNFGLRTCNECGTEWSECK